MIPVLNGVRSDRFRRVAVATTAVLQVTSAPLTPLLLGPGADTGAISDANISPVTPAGYAFAIWGLIYLGCLALAVYQALPGQIGREVHRRSGWWLVAGFASSTLWVPVFGAELIWLSEIVIAVLVVALATAAWRLTRSGAAATRAERWLLRLPVTVYLGWATCAAAAGFGTMLRSLGMPVHAGWVTAVSIAVVSAATGVSAVVVARFSALAGFVLTVCWALAAVAVASYEPAVRIASIVAVAVVLGVLIGRLLQNRQRAVVLLG